MNSMNPASTPDSGCVLAASARRPGERVGAYELQRLLGIGGVAEVWLARRADGAFERQVALKISRLSPMHDGMAATFVQECNTLAALEGPGIARLYDAGLDAGVPHFAMEHVRGETLTSWCGQRGLGLAERLRLFLQVLEVVGHAHARKVIHRDLKPSNILVTAQGEVRLLDFGVARLLQEQAAGQRPRTQHCGCGMTPEYASPELLRGQQIDVRSDIYSLGVVLHELLTGARPGQSRPDSAQRIALPPGMREVLAKAMATAPTDRYADVAGFAAELRRFEPGRRGASRAPGALLRYASIGVLAVAAVILGVLWQRGLLTDTGSTAPDAADILFLPSIAVLPFTDLSEARDQAYLGDGFAEGLLNLLTRVPALRVTARTSAFAFRGAPAEIPVIAQKLNVDHILAGSVRRAGNRLRFAVQLVEVATGAVLWSETYDRELQGIFDVQEDVANAVGDALKVRQPARQQVPAGERTRNTAAYEEYLLGLQLRDDPSLERQLLARAAFERAVQRDPRFAAAHAGVALTASLLGEMTMDSAHLDVAWAEAEQAIAMAPKLAVAYVARARARRARSWDFQGARRDLETARAIAPNNVEIMQAWGGHLATIGRFTEAVDLQRRGVERDPLSGAAWQWLGAALMGARDYKGAGIAFERAGELSPHPDGLLQSRALIALYSGNPVEALRLANLDQDPDARDFCLALAEFSAGNATAARAAVQRLIERAPDLRAAQISRAYAWLGDTEQAFYWLDRAIDLHDPGIAAILVIPELDALRRDPRYQRALYRMQLGRE